MSHVRGDLEVSYLDVIPDGDVSLPGGQHRPSGERLHHGRRLLVQRKPDLSGH